MKITKAVITTAGRGQRGLPAQSLVDRDGVEKKALEIILDEVVDAGAEAVCLVTAPGDEPVYRAAAGAHAPLLTFVTQPEPLGYGHAVLLARQFTAGQPFLHLVSDHLYVARGATRSARQVADLARAEGCAVSAVQPTRESVLRFYGTVGGRRVAQRPDLYEIQHVLEKPTPSEAEQVLSVPGVRAGFYLCFFGIHVFTPLVMDILAEQAALGRGGRPLDLSSTLAELARRERYLALEVAGQRHNIGLKYGLLTAQLALALDGVDREKILAQIVDLLAQRNSAHSE
ncbi:utp--glucose-1-phosphate uridylyltransferase : Putative UTP--glucose-1-phosphate uridylyltransferase OS=Caldilinea aerophila (strain DSM 14535 / JCM 11387 / NBRC 104270 / STL-6-O1) GN=CLDAP_34490 PE=4 SV=1: NTP_transferase [Gemmata massiliana]|uniref:UTP--glucose-1-phosphate uridylyltransferase n=1 Tax=Gemmata massiliana TaxID=1210884 RepID=A0A6P2D7A0_9BACT|nr:sugar phosphate nucleotidyltransferase [Gemmata massiliana]VTR95320.1 utp--glucose-1-phosphate uridylyltransferase : Putative UTP--glucose-1-phosphate uridylyltransferase OS=Caldilinea aerophila (strain DSM 14535 / JCM 11387 / NBRC 104270 / STL-6-O1) GN=CLDAP_34490 PE=4 SV=1: NTP_transferase [Gemmata massiliana]